MALTHLATDDPSTADLSSEGRRPQTIKWGLALTAAAWLCSRIVVGASWGAARNPFSFDTSQWVHSDSINYLNIAAHGRVFASCSSPEFRSMAALIHLWQLKWCGTGGWLPGYPWLMHAMSWTGISLPDAGVLISWVATAVAIFLVWFGWGRDLQLSQAFAVLLLFAIFPGAVYNFAVFPTAIGLAFLVGAILAATRERFFTMALLMTLAGLCYPTAWFAAFGLAVGLVIVAFRLGSKVIAQRALWGLAGFFSIVILGIHDQIAFGQSRAYFLTDSQAVDSLAKTWNQIYQLFISRNTIEQARMGRAAAPLYSLQVLIAVGLSIASFVLAVRRWLRDRTQALYIYPAMVGIGIILALIFTNNTWNRGVVLAAPCVVCFRRISPPVLWAIIVVVGTTTALISRSFFNGRFY